MLTIFGSKGGPNVFWCMFNIPAFKPSGLSEEFFSTVGPVSMHLPPNDGLYYDTNFHTFGLYGAELHQGFLRSTRGKKEIPNPCEHLNNKASIAYYGGGTPSYSFKSWNKFSSGTKASLSRSTSAAEVVSYWGFPTPAGAFKFYDRDGNIKTKNVIDLYYPQRLGWVSPIDPARGLLAGRIPYTTGQLVYVSKPPYAIESQWLEFYHRPSVVDRRTIKVLGHYASLSVAGSPYTGGYESYDADLKITHIKGNTDGTFQLRILRTWTKRIYYVDPYGRISGDQTTTGSDTTEKYIHIFKAGSIAETAGYDFPELSEKLNNYGNVATHEYSEKEAEYARSAAVQDISALESNNLENIAGLKGSFSVLGDLVKGYKAFKSGDVLAATKAVSGCYLWYKYAVAPTISDVNDVSKNTSRLVGEISKHRFSNERRRGKFTSDRTSFAGTISYFTTYHTQLKDDVYSTVWNALEKFGLQVDASQIWDLIPFSFVADWFIPIGKTLTEIDSYNSLCLTRNIKARIETYQTNKIEVLASPIPSLYDIIGPYEQSYYLRVVLSGPGRIDPLSGQTSTGNRSSQMVQGAALIVQQLH